MSWNGISTTVNAPGRQFSSGSLTSYFTAYLWGGAIVLFVNILVFPHSAEKVSKIVSYGSLYPSHDSILTLVFVYHRNFE